MPELYIKASNKHLGHISQDELKFLMKHLEEEDSQDEDYAISRMTLDYMKSQKISDNLLALLEEALGQADEVEVRFTQS